MKKKGINNEFGIKSIEKALTLLDLILASPEGISLAELAAKSSCPSSTVRNILRTMEKSDHVMRSKDHLYYTGCAFYPFFRHSLFSEEEKSFLSEQVKKISLLCGETVCLFGKDVSFLPENFSGRNSIFPLASHAGTKGVVAGEEAARNSIFSSSCFQTLFSEKEHFLNEKDAIYEGKTSKNALWNLSVAFPGNQGNTLAVLALFLPSGRATKERCSSLKKFLLLQKENSPLCRFFIQKNCCVPFEKGAAASVK